MHALHTVSFPVHAVGKRCVGQIVQPDGADRDLEAARNRSLKLQFICKGLRVAAW